MYYSLVYLPDMEGKINHFRKKYDPYHKIIDAHLTIIFPVPDSINKKKLTAHIATVLKKWKPFNIRLMGFEKAWDQWLFLVLKEGKQEVINLHDQLYKGILAEYLRSDIKFVPHIALGLFAKGPYNIRDPNTMPLDKLKYMKALAEAQKLHIDDTCTVKKFTLIQLDNKFTRSKKIREFYL
jgi:2'-5' RNA ligase